MNIDYKNRKIQCKIVYYGPAGSGKTTNLEMIAGPSEKRKIRVVKNGQSFFEMVTIKAGQIKNIDVVFNLFAVPGQDFYGSDIHADVRKMILKAADGIIFVADSQRLKLDENIFAMSELENFLSDHKIDVRKIPMVIQYNKRDAITALPTAKMDAEVNRLSLPTKEAIATNGEGVFKTLKVCTEIVLQATKQAFEEKKEKVESKQQQPEHREKPKASRLDKFG